MCAISELSTWVSPECESERHREFVLTLRDAFVNVTVERLKIIDKILTMSSQSRSK